MIGEEQQILVEVGEYSFCLALNEVLSIIPPPQMIRLPATRGAFTRAFKYQDELGATVSVRHQLELPEREDMSSGQILLGRINGRLAGFWFDKVDRILRIGSDCEQVDSEFYRLLPNDSILSLISVNGRIVPQVSLAGMIRFTNAEEFKRWYQEDIKAIENAILVKQWANEQELQQKAEQDTGITDAEIISLEEVYQLLDAADEVEAASIISSEALPGEQEPESLPVEQREEANKELAETVVEDSETEELVSTQEAGSDAVEPELTEETSSLDVEETAPVTEPEAISNLALPVEGSDDETSHQAIVNRIAQQQLEAESDLSAEEPQEDVVLPDARFKLEKKRERMKQRMNEGRRTRLSDFQIIKVSEAFITRIKRRTLKPLLRGSVLSILLLCINGTTQFIQQRPEPIQQLGQIIQQRPFEWPPLQKWLASEMPIFYRLSISFEYLQADAPVTVDKPEA
ncbi:MAG: chemotaxis protein CheW [Gammaproteobacteria bacterium]|nr:chemotaxis protein CheW [Gammaproteobacteria bacterium]